MSEQMPTYERLSGNTKPERETSVYYMEDVPSLPEDWHWPQWYLDDLKAMKGNCIWCGNELPGRKRKYCSEDCQWHYKAGAANYDLEVTSLRRYVHKWFNFQCHICGTHLSNITPAGVEYPVHQGEVDHITPLFQGGKDVWENLQLLCTDCHREKSVTERRTWQERENKEN